MTYLQNPFLGFCSFICKMKDIWPDILYSLRSTLSYSVGNSLINSLLILFILDDFSNCNGTTCLPFNRLIRSKKASYMSFSHPLFYWLAHLLLPSIKETKHLLVIIILNKQVRNFFKEKDAKIAFEFYKILRVLKWNPRSLCWRRCFAGQKVLVLIVVCSDYSVTKGIWGNPKERSLKQGLCCSPSTWHMVAAQLKYIY